MKIIIAGGTGFLGNALENYFAKQNHEVIILTRKPNRKNEVYWDAQTIGEWVNDLENSHVLINLVGKSVDCRYTDKNRDEILGSRLRSTEILQKGIDLCKNPPKIWLNSSSATIYIHAENELMTEANGIIGDDFSMSVCKAWEATFFEKQDLKIRKIALRTAIVFGKSGAFSKLKTITKLGLGGKQGNGRQKMSWIHIEDFCRAIDFIIQKNDIEGIINLCSPNPIRNTDFMTILRRVLKMPFGIPAPVFVLEFATLFLQTETELLLKSRNVYPEKLLQTGFVFRFPNVLDAVTDLS